MRLRVPTRNHVHLLIYLYSLIDCTEEGDEPNDVYISKLALGLGRSTHRFDHKTLPY